MKSFLVAFSIFFSLSAFAGSFSIKDPSADNQLKINSDGSLNISGMQPITTQDASDGSPVQTFNLAFPNFTGSHAGTNFTLGVNSIAGGGSGQTTANNALNAFLPAQSGHAGAPLMSDGTNTSWLTGKLGADFGGAGSSSFNINLWVDNGRVDTYTPDGTFDRPFKGTTPIADALAKLKANGNNATYPYTIHIMPGVPYGETITLNDAAYYNIQFKSEGAYYSNVGVGGVAVTSTSNNDGLTSVVFENMIFNGDIVMQGASAGTHFGANGIAFRNNVLNVTGINGLSFNNVSGVAIQDTQVIGGPSTITNVSGFSVAGNPPGVGWQATTFNLVTNYGANYPTGYSLTNVILDRLLMSTASISIDAGSSLTTRVGCRIGASGGTLTNAGSLTAYDTTFRSNIVNNGATSLFWSSWNGTFTGGGSLNLGNYSTQIAYAPGVSANWASPPSRVNDALDKLVVTQQSVVGSQPACSSANRGLQWLVQGLTGVADIYQVCQKTISDTYAWTTH